jgi:hypothetical protein
VLNLPTSSLASPKVGIMLGKVNLAGCTHRKNNFRMKGFKSFGSFSSFDYWNSSPNIIYFDLQSLSWIPVWTTPC